MYDAYRAPTAPPSPPKKPFWSRPKVGGAALVLGVLIGVSGTGDAESAPESNAAPAPATVTATQVVEVGPSDDDVQAQVDEAVTTAVVDLQDQLATQEEQAATDLKAMQRSMRKEAKVSQSAAVKRAVRRALADVEPVVVEVPAEPEPVSEPEPSTDPIFGTCGEANDNGYGPYRSGVDPEYPYYDDRDGDGVVCET